MAIDEALAATLDSQALVNAQGGAQPFWQGGFGLMLARARAMAQRCLTRPIRSAECAATERDPSLKQF